MEGKWSQYDCGQLGHWAEADDSHLFLSPPRSGSIPALPQHFRAELSPFVALVGSVEEKAYMIFDVAVSGDDKLWCDALKTDIEQELYEK